MDLISIITWLIKNPEDSLLAVESDGTRILVRRYLGMLQYTRQEDDIWHDWNPNYSRPDMYHAEAPARKLPEPPNQCHWEGITNPKHLVDDLNLTRYRVISDPRMVLNYERMIQIYTAIIEEYRTR